MTVKQQLTVELGERSYPILIGESLAAELSHEITSRFPRTRVALVTNDTIAGFYPELIETLRISLDALVLRVPDGESAKSLSTWSSILDALLTNRFDRDSILIAFGGGVIGDLSGFAASCFLRGIRFIQVPTTLLAMVDSSVGGKTGVNHQMGKNLIGTFHQPSLVIIDTSFLSTLPEREFCAGYGEICKYGFIGGSSFFDFIENHHSSILRRDSSSINKAIELSIQTKADIVSKDEHEYGLRALLNFGHTFAHSLERYYSYSNLLHGEAVLWGIACACELGIISGTIPPQYHSRYRNLCATLPRPPLPAPPDTNELLSGMYSDKKVRQGHVHFILPGSPGTASRVDTIPDDWVITAMKMVFS